MIYLVVNRYDCEKRISDKEVPILIKKTPYFFSPAGTVHSSLVKYKRAGLGQGSTILHAKKRCDSD